jgi:hypothetical protein
MTVRRFTTLAAAFAMALAFATGPAEAGLVYTVTFGTPTDTADGSNPPVLTTVTNFNGDNIQINAAVTQFANFSYTAGQGTLTSSISLYTIQAQNGLAGASDSDVSGGFSTPITVTITNTSNGSTGSIGMKGTGFGDFQYPLNSNLMVNPTPFNISTNELDFVDSNMNSLGESVTLTLSDGSMVTLTVPDFANLTSTDSTMTSGSAPQDLAVSVAVVAVPEPSSLALLSSLPLFLAGARLRSWRRKV